MLLILSHTQDVSLFQIDVTLTVVIIVLIRVNMVAMAAIIKAKIPALKILLILFISSF